MDLLDAVLPGSWQWGRVGDFFEVTRKPRGLSIDPKTEIPFTPMELIPQGGDTRIRYRLRPWGEVTSGTYFERGDLLIAKITPSFENGKQGLAEDFDHEFGYATTEVIPLRPRTAGYDRHLLFYFLLHPEARTWVAEKMEGSTGRQRVPERVLLDLPFPDIEPEHQTRLAGALRLIRDLIETNCATNRLLEQLFSSTLHRTLTGEAKLDQIDWSALSALAPQSHD